MLHGAHSYVLQDADGQIVGTHSVSAGLDYPGVGPEHAFLKDRGRVTYASVGDTDALDAFFLLTPQRGHHARARAGACAGLGARQSASRA